MACRRYRVYGNVDKFQSFKPFRAVYGNIDGQDIRAIYSKHLRFTVEGADIWMTHIGGYPGKYDREVIPEIYRNPPDLFISGHSHILKVLYDKTLKLLHINPGAAGKYGFHKKGHWCVSQLMIKYLKIWR